MFSNALQRYKISPKLSNNPAKFLHVKNTKQAYMHTQIAPYPLSLNTLLRVYSRVCSPILHTQTYMTHKHLSASKYGQNTNKIYYLLQ